MIRTVIFFALLFLAACGGSDSGGGSSSSKLELTKVTALIPTCFKGACEISFIATVDVPWEETEADGYMPVFAVGLGAPAPDVCDDTNTLPAPRGLLTMEVAPNLAISARGCAYNQKDNYYSPGLVTGVMLTPPSI